MNDALALEVRRLAAAVEAQASELAELRLLLLRLVPRQDERTATLLRALGAVLGEQAFSSAEAIELSRNRVGTGRADLAAALAALGIDGAHALGLVLRRCATGTGAPVEAVTHECGSRLWRIVAGV